MPYSALLEARQKPSIAEVNNLMAFFDPISPCARIDAVWLSVVNFTSGLSNLKHSMECPLLLFVFQFSTRLAQLCFACILHLIHAVTKTVDDFVYT